MSEIHQSKQGQTEPGNAGEDHEAPAPTAMAIHEPAGVCVSVRACVRVCVVGNDVQLS